MSFFAELKRRNVLRVGTAYVVSSWLIIQVAETIFPLFGFDETPARIVVVVLGIGLVPVLVFAWAFELTPEGLKKEKDVDRSRSITPRTGRTLDRVIMVVLALALGYFAFDKFVLDPQREAELVEQKSAELEKAREAGRAEARVESYGDKSIAVLPFMNMSADSDQEYFSDGIAEELLNLLAKLPNLRVISRSSAFSLKGQNLEVPEIADRLNVGHVLEGSVRKAGNRVRITVQLIEARSDTHLWSETYDRELSDIFAIQDEIAATVVDNLKVRLFGPAPQSSETDPEVYSLYLEARHLGRLVTAQSMERAVELLKQAVAIDPGYAPAWHNLAANYSDQANLGLRPPGEGFELARESARKALEADPNYAPAYASLGFVALFFDEDLQAAAGHFRKALELDNRDLRAIGGAATFLFMLRRLDETIALEEYMVERDPLSSSAHSNIASSYMAAGRFDDAVTSLRTAMRLSPDRVYGRSSLAYALLMSGDAQAALEAVAGEQDPGARAAVEAQAHYALGDMDGYRAGLDAAIAALGAEWPSAVAEIYAYAGAADEAFEWLERAEAQDQPGLGSLWSNPGFSRLEADPRWDALMKRLGVSPEQLAQIPFEATLPR